MSDASAADSSDPSATSDTESPAAETAAPLRVLTRREQREFERRTAGNADQTAVAPLAGHETAYFVASVPAASEPAASVPTESGPTTGDRAETVPVDALNSESTPLVSAKLAESHLEPVALSAPDLALPAGFHGVWAG